MRTWVSARTAYLYVSTGDGGCDYEPTGNCGSQRRLARSARAARQGAARHRAPARSRPTNPFQGAGTARCNITGRTDPGNKCQETYAWGLRNPFRIAFDPNATGTRFFINDVGEINWEEIDLGHSGADYGWNVREGFCVSARQNCGPPPAGMTNPIHAYDHYTVCTAITGGRIRAERRVAARLRRRLPVRRRCLWAHVAPRRRARGRLDQTDFASGFGDYSIVTMTFGPSGDEPHLYYATWNHEDAGLLQIRRISYEGADRAGYARPKGATPLRASLVPAYSACAAPNRTHGPPLAFGSCSPPGQASPHLTVGTPDANGAAPNFAGSVRLEALPGDAGTPADEADLQITASLSDVRLRSGLADYTGQLVVRLPLRLTDRDNGGPAGFGQGTLEDRNFDAAVPCAATSESSIGSTCSLTTTADAITPGVIGEGDRALWQLGALQVFDGGADGVASTTPNSVFASQGIFIP